MNYSVAASLALAAALAAAPLAAASGQTSGEFEDVHRCDEYAAHPQDPDRWASGVLDQEIVPGPAIKFCTQAVEEHPETARFQFQLGRAFWASERHDEAVGALIAATEMEYAPAYAYLGAAYQYGVGGVEPDIDTAREFYAYAANSGFTAATEFLAQLDQEVVATTFDPHRFQQPQIIGALYDGNFQYLRDNEFAFVRYFGAFSNTLPTLAYYSDPPGLCTLLVDSRVERYVANFVMGGGSSGGGTGNALQGLEMLGEFMKKFEGNPGALYDGLMQGTIDVSVLIDSAKKDATGLATIYGCDSEIAERIYTNGVRFLTNERPITGAAYTPGDESQTLATPKYEPRIETQASTSGDYITLHYDNVPDDFLPDIPTDYLSGDVAYLGLQLSKSGAGTLSSVRVYPNAALGLYDLYYYDMPDDEKNALRADSKLLTEKGQKVLYCFYRSARSANSGKIRLFWYEKMVPEAQPQYLRARLSDHPILKVNPVALTNCPLTLEEAEVAAR